MNNDADKKYLRLAIWAGFLACVLYIYFFKEDYLKESLSSLMSLSLVAGGLVYLLLGFVRGFTLIPVTYLIIFGSFILPPWTLFFLTMIGVLMSSLVVFYFSKHLGFDVLFARKHSKSVDKLKNILQKNELPIVTLWSAAPFLPTDVMCYVCGVLNVDLRKFLLGVLIGEGAMCWIYIFLGRQAIDYLGAYL